MSNFGVEAPQSAATALLVPTVVGWSLSLWVAGIYTTAHINYVRSSTYKRIAWPVKTVLHLVFVLICIFEVFEVLELCWWSSTQDRTLEHFTRGEPYESAPPLLFAFIAALVQSFLAVRTTSLLPSRRFRCIFGVVLAVLIAFALIMATLVFVVNITGLLHSDFSFGWVNFNSALASSLVANCVIDLGISASLTYTLRRRVVGIDENRDSFLTRMAIVILQTAAYTTFLSLGGAIAACLYTKYELSVWVAYAFFPILAPAYGLALYSTISTYRTVDDYIGSGPMGDALPIPGSKEHGIHQRSMRHRSPQPVYKPSLPSTGLREVSFGEGYGGRDVSALGLEEKGTLRQDETARMV